MEQKEIWDENHTAEFKFDMKRDKHLSKEGIELMLRFIITCSVCTTAAPKMSVNVRGSYTYHRRSSGTGCEGRRQKPSFHFFLHHSS